MSRPELNPIQVNDVFGELTARLKMIEPRRQLWLCECSCGKTATVQAQLLKSGRTKSCGHLRKTVSAAKIKHGASRSSGRTSEYSTWKAMKARCYNVKNKRYANYGGRGITVCDKWLNSFTDFLRDVGYRPGKEYTLDRINNNGHYEPGNVRWATQTQQQRNRAVARQLTINGVTKPLAEWAEEYDIPPAIVRQRIDREGLNPLQALSYKRTSKRGKAYEQLQSTSN